MTQKERDAIRGILKDMEHPSAPGSAMELVDGEWKMTREAELVPGTPNHKLLDSNEYKAGYARAWHEIQTRLAYTFLVDDKTDMKALRDYARRGQEK